MKYVLFFMTGFCWAGFIASVSAQKLPEGAIPYLNRVRVHTEAGIIEASLWPAAKKGENSRPDRWYSWYEKDSIFYTQGGYRGRLLHGTYAELYPSRQLKVSGTYHKGLKTGTWQYHDENGSLRKISHWSNGMETGPYSLYTEQGELLQKGHLKNGKPRGANKFPLIFWKRK